MHAEHWSTNTTNKLLCCKYVNPMSTDSDHSKKLIRKNSRISNKSLVLIKNTRSYKSFGIKEILEMMLSNFKIIFKGIKLDSQQNKNLCLLNKSLYHQGHSQCQQSQNKHQIEPTANKYLRSINCNITNNLWYLN